MELQKIENLSINENYYYLKHTSGLSIYVYPKQNFSSTYAIFGTKFGSINNKFKLNNGEIINLPDGTAHFLEHKLFEKENTNAFEQYAITGASANAFTSFDKTAYLFSCADNFYESLNILLDFVQTPFFSEESVQKEQGIIAQEIKMYQDSPSWRVFINLLNALYFFHPVKIDIAGSMESIAQITPEILYKSYNVFYNPKNMALCIAGNVKIDELISKIDAKIVTKSNNSASDFDLIFPDEPGEIVTSKITQNLEVIFPIFNLGFKENVKNVDFSDEETVYTEIILNLVSSQSSALYEKLLSKNLINMASFSCEYFRGAKYSSIIFSGESENPEKTAEIIYEEIEKIKNKDLNEFDFNTMKKVLYAENVSRFNRISKIANRFLNDSFTGHEMFREIELIKSAKIEDAQKRLKELFIPKFSALSVINPNAK